MSSRLSNIIADFSEIWNYDVSENVKYDMTKLVGSFKTIADEARAGREGPGEASLTAEDLETLEAGAKSLRGILSQVDMPDGAGSNDSLVLQRSSMWEGRHEHGEACQCSLRLGGSTAVLTESGSIKSPPVGTVPGVRDSIDNGSDLFTVYDPTKSLDEGWTLPSLGPKSAITKSLQWPNE
jgi:hypothetical protein